MAFRFARPGRGWGLVAALAAGCGSGLPLDAADSASPPWSDAVPGDAAAPAPDAALDGVALDSAIVDGAALDLAIPDAASVDGAIDEAPRAPIDLAGGGEGGLDAAGDLATARDGSPADSGGADLWNCAGGYLGFPLPDGGAAAACPLGCSKLIEAVADEGAIHVPFCTPVPYAHNPPASGPHWPWHADWGVYDGVPQREWWVHCLEHGGIVLLYNCPPAVGDGGVRDGGLTAMDCPDAGAPPPPSSCPNEMAALAKLYAQHAIDQLGVVRIVVAPDPKLPKRFAAVAWDWTWVSDQLDLPALQCFIDARYGRGPEEAP